jgi:hypothetical protein
LTDENNSPSRRIIMNDSSIRAKTRTLVTPRASLVAIGTQIQQRRILDPIRQQVHIAQKVIQHTPTDKLIDALIGMLAGAKGIVETNTTVRADRAVQRAFGRQGCAEQSTIQDTLNHATAQNVAQLEQACDEIFAQHSAAAFFRNTQTQLVLDVDLSGLVCGKKAECATKGYFDGQYHRRGRQLGRVLASPFDEVVADQIFPGNAHLGPVLEGLMTTAERRLMLSEATDVAERAHILVRLDAGGGGMASCNWLLARGYQLLTKDYSSQRAGRLAQSVRRWVEDPRCAGRQVGWVLEPTAEYVRPLLRIAVRCRSEKGRWRTAVLVTSLWPEEALERVWLSAEEWAHPDAELLALVYLYDQRGGAAETSFKGDKQGLGLQKRAKRHWEGQRMLTLLGMVAHNLVVWSRRWLALAEPRVQQYGIERMVRDIYQLHGRVILNGWGQVIKIVFSVAIPLAKQIGRACRKLFGTHSIVISLGKT